METDTITFIVETERTVIRRYRVIVHEDENPWDVWRRTQCPWLIYELFGEEKPISVERVDRIKGIHDSTRDDDDWCVDPTWQDGRGDQ